MKSRIAGSVDQARRSAARVRSAGTPGAKKGRMSDAAPIDSIGGKFAASKGDSVGEGCPGFAMDWSELVWRHAVRSTQWGEKIPGLEPLFRPRERPARVGPSA